MEVDTKTGIIYCWRNVHNGKRYIGQTINPKKRYKAHKQYLGNYSGANFFHRAMNKYSSMDDWEYTIIEEVPKELLDEREIHWIAFYDSNNPKHGYNMATGGNRHDGFELSEETKKKISEFHKGNSWNKGKQHSEETKKKISEALRGRPAWNKGKHPSEATIRKSAESNRGRKRTPETCRKISEANRGKKRSEESRRKMSEAQSPNLVAVYQNDTLISICNTALEAAHIAGVAHCVVNKIASGKWSKTKSGYSFKYISKSA